MNQVAMVIDLNKCIGCQTCTAACKSMWTDEPGQEYMLWNNVETVPGCGYPKDWEQDGGGWVDGKLRPGRLPEPADYGMDLEVNHQEVYFEGSEQRLQAKPRAAAPRPDEPAGKTSPLRILNNEPEPEEPSKDPQQWGANWDEDSSSGEYPNNYHFYLPRLCNHCTKPLCLEACPTRAIYRREQDGVVLIDQDKCKGFRECNKACPYDKIYFNHVTGKSQKCIFCFPRLEEGVAPACARQCPGRLRFVGFLDDEDGPIHRLVYGFMVALPLHPEYGTEPNVFYVPPILPPTFDEEGEISDQERVPTEYLESLFGDGVGHALETLEAEMEKTQRGEQSELMDLLIAKDWKAMFAIPDVKYA
ncbi:MAG: respiratory nitrate reductase subunit beta [bacterium]|nr:respiratory nitrate reductase subunit beta [bacterium]